MSDERFFSEPDDGTEAERFERSGDPRHALRANLTRLYRGAWTMDRVDEDLRLTWTVDEGEERRASIVWRHDPLSGHAWLESDERGDRTGFAARGDVPAPSPCPEGCPLSHRAAWDDRVPILAMPGSRLRDVHGEERVLQHASARANRFPYLPDAALITPFGDRHGRPATWPEDAFAEALLLVATLERRAAESPEVLGLDVFQNLGTEAFGSQDHPHLQVVPRPAGLPWPATWSPPQDPSDEIVHRVGTTTVRLRRALGDPWIDLGPRRGLRELAWEELRHVARLWRRIDLAYHQADCHHLNVLLLLPPFAADRGRSALVFVARERGWARGRAGFELLERDAVWVTGRSPRALAEHFRSAFAEL